MPPKAKRAKRDPDVVYTERDYRRASGKEDENDFEQDLGAANEADYEKVYTYTTLSRSIRIKYNKSTPRIRTEAPFSFTTLPPEIRNMIYRYLVVSLNPKPIELGGSTYFEKGGIQTAILTTSRQVSEEARSIMYAENRFTASYTGGHHGISLREDNRHTAHSTARALRSGRVVDMMKHKGLVYGDIVTLLQNVDINVKLFDRMHSCDVHTWFAAFRCHYRLQELVSLLETRRSLRDPKPWKLTIRGCEFPFWDPHGNNVRAVCSTVTYRALRPLLNGTCKNLVLDGLIEICVEGKFAEGTKKLFRHLDDLPGVNTTRMSKLDEDKVRKVRFPTWQIHEIGLPIEHWISHMGIEANSLDERRKLEHQLDLFFKV